MLLTALFGFWLCSQYSSTNTQNALFSSRISTPEYTPNRLWLLLELIEKQTAKGNIQVITTTHNPALLAWMNDETFENTSVVWRDEYASDSVIRPIAGLYNLRELRKSRGMEGLFTSGWLESAMKASEGDFDTDHLDDDDEEDIDG